MNSLFEQARKKINEGKSGLLIAFFILLLFIYGLIWEIIEPMNLPESFTHCNHNIFTSRLFYHITLSSFLALGITYYLFLKIVNYIEKISLNPLDTNLITCWEHKEGNTNLEELRDGYLGRIVKISGSNHNAIDLKLKPNSQSANRIEYIAKTENDFILYLKLRLKPSQGSDSTLKWIAMVLYSVSPEPKKGPGESEWSFPLKPHNLLGPWMRYSVDISEAVNKTFGTVGWKYLSLDTIRIRGNGEIQSITIY